MQQMQPAVSPSREVLTQLKELILEVTQMKISPAEIADNANLFNDCGLDSTSVVDLVVGIEEKFDIGIDDDELDIKLFQDLSVLAAFVEDKQIETREVAG
jgi:acyl carrier protein